MNTGRSMRADGVLPRLLLVVVLALGQAVLVLHRGDRQRPACFLDLVDGDLGQADRDDLARIQRREQAHVLDRPDLGALAVLAEQVAFERVERCILENAVGGIATVLAGLAHDLHGIGPPYVPVPVACRTSYMGTPGCAIS